MYFKCTVCPNYQICIACEERQCHLDLHPMTCVRKPLKKQFDVEVKPLNIMPGQKIKEGQEFFAKFNIKNIGATEFPEDTIAQIIQSSDYLKHEHSVYIGQLACGASKDIRIKVFPKQICGRAQLVYEIRSGSNVFDQRINFYMQVVEDEVLTSRRK